MAYPGRQSIYEATIRRMVQGALKQQEEDFLLQHRTDTDEQLLLYLRSWAARLHHTPQPVEVVGEQLMEERFGSWERACSLAKLPPPRTGNPKKPFARVLEETEKQKELYRLHKAEKKSWPPKGGTSRRPNARQNNQYYMVCAPPYTGR